MSKNRLIIVILTLFILYYPFLRLKTDADKIEINKFQESFKQCRGDYTVDKYFYIIEVQIFNDMYSSSFEKCWQELEGLPFHLRLIGSVNLLFQRGYTVW